MVSWLSTLYRRLSAGTIARPVVLSSARSEVGSRGLRQRCSDPEAIWQALDNLRLVASLSGGAADFASAETRRRLERFERATFCIEHLGLPNPDEPAPYPTYRAALRLAELPNVYLK